MNRVAEAAASILAPAAQLTRMAQLARLAHLDPRTGLHNARALDEHLNRLVRTSTASGQPFSVLFLDLDHFKRVNDRHGHAAGDAVLIALAELLRQQARKQDFVARYGGEEFVVVLPGVGADEALSAAERIRGLVATHLFRVQGTHGHVSLHCTLSIGVASFPLDASDAQTVLQRADAAMYRAKQIRNSVSRSADAPALPAPMPASPAGGTEASAARDAAPAAPRSLRPAMVTAGTWSLAILGIHALVSGMGSLAASPPAAWLGVGAMVLVGVLAELLRVEVYETDKERLSLSFSIAATLAAVAHRPEAAPLVALAGAAAHLIVAERHTTFRKALAHASTPVVAAWLAGIVYPHTHAGVMAAVSPTPGTAHLAAHLVAALASVCMYFGSHVVLISLMTGLYMGRSLTWVARHSMWFGSANVLLGATGAFLGAAYAQIGWLGIFMFVVPVLVMRSKLIFYAEQTRRQMATLRAAKAEVEQAQDDKDDLLRRMVETVASIIDARDNSVSGHSHQVARFAVAVGQEMGLDRTQLASLHTAGLFHDLGKVGVPEALLHKPSRLTDDEYATVREHAELGERILRQVPQLRHVARMVGEHHERYDGSGYPRRKRGTQISLGGRILVVVDALESMLANRSYSRGRGLPRALAELDRCAGTHFDPEVVAAVHRVVQKLGAAFFMEAYDAPSDPLESLAPAHPTEGVAAPARGPAERILAEALAA